MQKNTSVPLELLQKKRIDSFFIHQCMIRRFKLNHSADYDALLCMRNDIESVLSLAGLGAVPKNQFEISSTEVTMASMSFFENSGNRILITFATAKPIRERFYKHLSLSINSRLDITYYLSEDNIDAITNILENNILFYEGLIYKYNIFDYFSLFSMTVYIPFDKFYKFYRQAFNGKTEIYGLFKNITREAKWLYVNECDIDSNIYISITSTCCNHFYYSSNVHIIHDEDNDIVINGIKSTNALYLKVPVDQSPNNIDAAIEYFKDAIVEQLVNHFGCMANSHDDGFGNSIFMKLYNKKAYFVTQWNCIDNNIFGLWCWDLVKNENNTVAKAVQKIAESASYEEATIRKDYDEIEGILTFKFSKKKKVTLDQFVTGSDRIILGLREANLSSV